MEKGLTLLRNILSEVVSADEISYKDVEYCVYYIKIILGNGYVDYTLILLRKV